MHLPISTLCQSFNSKTAYNISDKEGQKWAHQKRRKAITEIGRVVPSNFEFGIIVAMAIFGAEFLKSVLNAIASLIGMTIPCLTELIIALLATAIAYFVLVSYRRIQSRLKKIKI